MIDSYCLMSIHKLQLNTRFLNKILCHNSDTFQHNLRREKMKMSSLARPLQELPYLPIQKLAKIFPSNSSDEIEPVSIPK